MICNNSYNVEICMCTNTKIQIMLVVNYCRKKKKMKIKIIYFITYLHNNQNSFWKLCFSFKCFLSEVKRKKRSEQLVSWQQMSLFKFLLYSPWIRSLCLLSLFLHMNFFSQNSQTIHSFVPVVSTRFFILCVLLKWSVRYLLW